MPVDSADQLVEVVFAVVEEDVDPARLDEYQWEHLVLIPTMKRPASSKSGRSVVPERPLESTEEESASPPRSSRPQPWNFRQ